MRSQTYAVAVSRDGSTANNNGTVSVIDRLNDDAITTITVGGTPWFVAVS